MRILLILYAILASTLAVPGGYFYQESSSKSSSSSYKNNELQHQTEDESYYSKRGDTEGRVTPKINTYSQHLEYQNPNKGENDQLTGISSNNGLKHFDNSDRYTAEHALGSDGIVRTVSGNRNQYSYRATYGVSGGQVVPLQAGHYDTQSNLLSLTQRLQNELSRQLSSDFSSYDSHGTSGHVETELRQLESELKANLTRQLQEELQRQYGTQVNRGTHSYSIKSGHYSPEANYNTQELEDLTNQVQNNLIQQLRNQYQSSHASSSSSRYYTSQQTEQGGSRTHGSLYRPYQETFPLNPEISPSTPLTEVVSQVQNIVDSKLNEALFRVEEQYLKNVAYTTDVPNYDTILQNLNDELKYNLSIALEDILLKYYGAQEEHNNYYYSSSNIAGGSKVANYKIDDLNSLKQQVENNLLQKLRNSIKQQRQTYQTSQRQTYGQTQTYSANHNTGYVSNRPVPGKVYTSYVVYTPSSRPDTVHTQQVNAHDSEASYSTYGEQINTRPAPRPSYVPTNSERPVRYGAYQPSSHGTNYGSTNYQTASQNQESQQVEEVEYGYSPSGGQGSPGRGHAPISQSQHRGPYHPSSTGTSYPVRNVNYPASNVNYPSSSGGSYPSSNVNYPTSGTGTYPSSSTDTYPSSSGSNYQTSQSNREASYKVVVGQHQSGIEYIPGSSRPSGPQTDYQAELINIRDQVQSDLSRQLSSAIERQKQSETTYTSSTASDNRIFSELSEELKRNLTQKIEQALGRHGVRGGYSFTVSSGGGYNREQLTRLTNQLQEDLLRQLSELLAQQSYRQSASHSGSSSSYEPITAQGTYDRGSNAYRTYSSGSYSKVYRSGGGGGECCMQADASTTTTEEVNQGDRYPERGDIGVSTTSIKKNKDITVENLHDHDNKQRKDDNQSVDLEIVPPEITESSTPGLARNRPSIRPLIIKPIRPKHNDSRSTTQQLLDSERYDQQSENQYQTDQEIDSLNHFDQQNLDHFGNLDQQSSANLDQFEQTSDIHQQTVDQHESTGISQQTVDQETVDQHESTGISQQTVEQQTADQHESTGISQQTVDQETVDQDESTGISQQTIDQFDQTTDQQQFENQNVEVNRFTRPSTQSQRFESVNPQLPHIDDQSSIDQAQYNAHQTQHVRQHSGVNRYVQHGRDRISQIPYGSQNTEDLTQQTEDLTQQTEDLTQQTEDLTQQAHQLTQQSEVLTHQHSDAGQENEHLMQQLEDLVKKSLSSAQELQNQGQLGHSHRPSQNSYVRQQPEVLAPQTVVQTQETEDLTQQSQDLHQQSHNQQIENLNHQTNFPRRYSGYHSGASQNRHVDQTQDLTQQTEDLTQQTEDLTQQTEDLTQQTEDLTQQTEDLTQQSQDLRQEIEPSDYQGSFLHGYSRPTPNIGNGGSYGSHPQSSFTSSSYSSASENRQLQHGTINQVALHTTKDLEQQHVEEQHASVVQDVSHQVSHPDANSEIKVITDEEISTTEKPGFWKKLGGKISKTYNKAKDSITSIG